MHFNRSLVLCGGLFASLIFSSGIGLGQTAEFSAKLSQWFEELPTVGTDSFVVPLVNPDDHGELGEITLEIDFEELDEIAQQVCEGDIAPAKANVVTVQPNHRLVRKLDLLHGDFKRYRLYRSSSRRQMQIGKPWRNY